MAKLLLGGADMIHYILLPALAMCLGWGIRGQFGGETGAMVPGALVALALALLSGWRGTDAARLAAVGAFACSLGGMETYGQTIWLVQGQSPSPTYWWGLLGLAIKGGAWIGLTGIFLAIAVSDRYRRVELLALIIAMLVFGAVGLYLLNRPHNPPDELPFIYFSKRFDPKPRVEWWGGLWFALLTVMLYAGAVKKHRQAVTMGLWGILGGAIGFSVGEMLQAWGTHQTPFGQAIQPFIDWWKVMEMSFGFIAGAVLGIGWKLTRLSEAPIPSIKPWARPLDDLTILLWVIPILAIDLQISWAEGWGNLPDLWMLLALLGSLVGSGWAPFGTGVAVTLVSASDTLRYLWDEHQLIAFSWGFAGLVVLTLVAGYLSALWYRQGAPVRTWFLWTAWMQTALTWIKLAPVPLLKPDGRGWLERWGSAAVVELSFVLLAVLLTVLASAWGRHSAAKETSTAPG